jgi:hypothetical protein
MQYSTVDEHFGWVVILAVDPAYDPLRAEPRFKALQQRVHINQNTSRTSQ